MIDRLALAPLLALVPDSEADFQAYVDLLAADIARYFPAFPKSGSGLAERYLARPDGWKGKRGLCGAGQAASPKFS